MEIDGTENGGLQHVERNPSASFHYPVFKAIVAAVVIIGCRDIELASRLSSFNYAENYRVGLHRQGQTIHYSREWVKSLTLSALQKELMDAVS